MALSPAIGGPEWVVIGHETDCGDPIFASDETPNPVFSAIQEEGPWEPKLVAQSIGVLAKCVREFQGFPAGSSGPVELDTTQIELDLNAFG